MNDADKIVIEALQPFMSPFGYANVVTAVEKAGGIKNLTDTVALMELIVAKRKFGSRSAAASYAANVRWQGKKPEMELADSEGNKYRTAKLDGVDTQFKVSAATASDAKEGDIISVGSHRVPTKVQSVKQSGDKLVITAQNLNNTDKVETTIRPNAAIRKWTPDNTAPPPAPRGALNPSRRVDPSKVSSAEVRYINEGKTPQDRVRRANEVIDRNALSGKDVTKPPRGKGGAQWLEFGKQ